MARVGYSLEIEKIPKNGTLPLNSEGPRAPRVMVARAKFFYFYIAPINLWIQGKYRARAKNTSGDMRV